MTVELSHAVPDSLHRDQQVYGPISRTSLASLKELGELKMPPRTYESSTEKNGPLQQSSSEPGELQESPSFLRRLSDTYFKPMSFESKSLYEKFGIRYLQRLFSGSNVERGPGLVQRRDFFRRVPFLWHQRVWNNASATSLKKYETIQRCTEAAHAIAGADSIGRFAETPSWSLGIIGIGMNFAFVALHRYNRIRLRTVIDKLSRREAEQRNQESP